MNYFAMFVSAVAVGSVLTLPPCYPARAEASPAPANESISTVTIKIEGMTCAACAFTIRTALKKLDGVNDAKVSKAEGLATVSFDASKVTPQRMVDAINKLGYQASLPVKKS